MEEEQSIMIPAEEAHTEEQKAVLEEAQVPPHADSAIPADVYRTTASQNTGLVDGVPFYKEVAAAFVEGGKGTVELRKRYMLKAIDEEWVRAVEDAIPALDVIIRNPGMLLQEKESVMPIEQTRRVTGRSIQHLCQHTDYINSISEDGTVMPTKLLNVFQDETILSYENKFINTLLSRLYAFVERRYSAAEESGEDEKNTRIEFTQEFARGEQTGKINFSIEVSEKPQDKEVVRNYIYTTDLWRRVQKIYKIVTTYMDSNFVQQMGRNYVHPPIMRTNKILKNVEFKQCLTLWEFLDSYENTGYETLIGEDLEEVSDECIGDFYRTFEMQYVLFENHIRNVFEGESAFDTRVSEEALKPKFIDEFEPFDEKELDQPVAVPEPVKEIVGQTGMENRIEEAVLIALAADSLYTAEEVEGDEQTLLDRGQIRYRYRYSFLARLILAQNPTQDYYTAIKNEILAYKDIRDSISWDYESFYHGRLKCARINVKGKTLFLYLPLDPAAYPVSKYHQVDASASHRFEDVPFLLKVRSDRGLKYAKELIAEAMAKLGMVRLPETPEVDYHLPYQTAEEMAALVPPLVKIIGEEQPAAVPIVLPPVPEVPEVPETPAIAYRFRFSFTARLIQASKEMQDYYGQIKNYMLSFDKVKDKTAWGFESYRYGRRTLLKIKARGKALVLQMALDPAPYADSKYHVKDVSEKNEALPLVFKVRSARAAKYALELIDAMMASVGAVQGVIPKRSYRMAYRPTEALVRTDPPLVKSLVPLDQIPLPPEEEGIAYRYRFSFTARLTQAEDETQENYQTLKNYLLSFGKVKDKSAWGYESYRYGRRTLVKMKLRGKNIVLLLDLDPAALAGTKYKYKDMTAGGEKSAALAVQIKVRSHRSLKYAMELIDTLMASVGAVQGEIPAVPYRLPFRTTEELLADGLVKAVGSASAARPAPEKTKDEKSEDEDGEDEDSEDGEDEEETEDGEEN